MATRTARAPLASRASASSPVLVDVQPKWPYRLPGRGGPDGVSRVRAGIHERFLRVDGAPILVRAWERRRDRKIAIAAIPVDPAWLSAAESEDAPRADRELLERAAAMFRHALAVDDDLAPFYAEFKRDPLLGPAIRRTPWLRARRCPRPWEALAWAVTEQLIEAVRAHRIQRRIVGRWGDRLQVPDSGRQLRDIPCPETISGRAPAELAALDLAPKRALALIRVAREVRSGRARLDDPGCDDRLLAIPDIGPWTLQVMALKGRGDPDALPFGDLAYVKLVGRLAGFDRRATVREVEQFYAPYAPYRALAGLFTLVAYGRQVAQGPPQKIVQDLRDAA